jgi:hypothetical protein
MKRVNPTAMVLVAACLVVVPLSWSQEAKSPADTKESGKTSGKGMTATEQARKISAIKAERLALRRQAEAIEARHQALDAEIAAWSENVDRWIKSNGITIDPARVVLSLSSRSFFLHESPHAGVSSGDPEYSHLEAQMTEIQAKRKKIEGDWLDLLSRDRASIVRSGLKPAETQQSFDFDLGDSTIPIPGISARQRCCALTLPDGDILHGCKLTKEGCAKNEGSKGWHLVCYYECDPIVLTLHP